MGDVGLVRAPFRLILMALCLPRRVRHAGKRRAHLGGYRRRRLGLAAHDASLRHLRARAWQGGPRHGYCLPVTADRPGPATTDAPATTEALLAGESPAPAAVVFDNDGLLLDTEPCWTAAQEALFRANGREFRLAAKHALIGTSPKTAAPILARLLDQPESLGGVQSAKPFQDGRPGTHPRLTAGLGSVCFFTTSCSRHRSNRQDCAKDCRDKK